MELSDVEVDRMIREGTPMVRQMIAQEIGQTVIAGFEHAGLHGADALYTALHMARELPYDRLRLRRQQPTT